MTDTADPIASDDALATARRALADFGIDLPFVDDGIRELARKMTASGGCFADGRGRHYGCSCHTARELPQGDALRAAIERHFDGLHSSSFGRHFAITTADGRNRAVEFVTKLLEGVLVASRQEAR